ncbi:MAG: hypothetical protein QM761_03310 [Pseudoxanthomonas sp.]
MTPLQAGAPTTHPHPRTAWRAYLPVACVVVLLLLWQSPLAAGWRPAVGFGIDWRNLLIAWLPEGIALGLLCFCAEHIVGARRQATAGRASVAAVLRYLVLFAPAWLLGVLLPGVTVLCGFAASVQPLKEVFALGGPAGGILAGGVTLAYALLAIALVLAELAGAVLWIATMQPRMACGGRDGMAAARHPAARFGIAALAGAAFWSTRLLAAQVIDDATGRGLAGVVAALLIAGWCAFLFQRHPLPR